MPNRIPARHKDQKAKTAEAWESIRGKGRVGSHKLFWGHLLSIRLATFVIRIFLFYFSSSARRLFLSHIPRHFPYGIFGVEKHADSKLWRHSPGCELDRMCNRFISVICSHIHHLEDHATYPTRSVFDLTYFCMELLTGAYLSIELTNVSAIGLRHYRCYPRYSERHLRNRIPRKRSLRKR